PVEPKGQRPPMDVDAYVNRIGLDGSTAVKPDLATLHALQAAHVQSVPFENLDIHLGVPIVLDTDAFYEKVVDRRRGGYCYELNGLLAAMLRDIGFDARLVAAQFHRDGGEPGPPFEHARVVVTIGGRRWLADVGNGASYRVPLAIDDSSPSVQPQGTF